MRSRRVVFATMGAWEWSKFIDNGWPILLAGMATISTVLVFKDEVSMSLPHQNLRRDSHYPTTKFYIPPSLDAESQRRLAKSINLGGGLCQWQPPYYEVPQEIDFHKTLVTGFPSGDKRIVFLQMEALTGWPAKDEWDFAFEGMSNHPYIKANYPHHEGIWGWESSADQVVLVVPFIRRAMVEYHDIVWDLGYAKTWEDATALSENLYVSKPHLDDYYEWRDDRVFDEASWYGWFIDYWMEGGLLRDIFTHKLTTDEHWNDLMLKPFYTRAELAYENYVSNGTTVQPAYDPLCGGGEISNGCAPVEVISADWLRNNIKGPAETSKIANALLNDDRTGQYVIEQEAWDCIWDELIINRKGPRTVWDRPGVNEYGYNFSAEMLEGMLFELNRLINKYNSPEWRTFSTANRLVDILVDHRSMIQVELNEVNSGLRKLTDKDFLGPKTRALRKRNSNEESNSTPKTNEHSKHFTALEQKRFEGKRSEIGKRSKGDYLEATKALAQSLIAELGPTPTSKLQVE